MPYVEPEIIEQVRQIDLLTYLRKFEPDNVEEVKGTKNVYRTVDHDSLKLSDKSQELFFYGRSGNPYGKRTGKLDAATEKRRKN